MLSGGQHSTVWELPNHLQTDRDRSIMNATPLSLVFTVLGGLLLAAILGWLRKPRLVVLVPRLFSYSHLTDRGQLAEITVFNRGFKTEETVELSLSPTMQYNMVGSNSEDVSLTKNKLTIPRIGPGDEMTALLLVEGGSFSRDDISNCLSKETKGRIVAKLEEVPPTGPQRIGLLATFIAVPLILYSLPYAFDYIRTGTLGEKKATTEIQGWAVPRFYESTSELFTAFKDGRILVSLGVPSRKKDIVTIPATVQNKTGEPFRYSLRMTTRASEDRIPSYERALSDVFVAPSVTSDKSLNVVIPVQPSSASEKMVFVNVFIQSERGDSLSLNRTFSVE